jgi:tellurite resistance protein TehA-like permease
VKLGQLADTVLQDKGRGWNFNFANGGPYLFFVGSLSGLLLWGFAMWWLAIAIIATIANVRQGLPFSLGWWTFTFPFGSLANGTLALGDAFSAPFFTYLGEIMAWAVVLLHMVCALFTIKGVIKGTLLTAPCLNDNLDLIYAERREH